MDLITALAVSIGLLGGVATYLFLTLGMFAIWIAFIGWASFFHCGGGMDGFKKSVAANIWGAICGFVALLLITKVDLGLPGVLWASIAVAVTVFVMIIAAKVEALGAIPAAVYGYAATAGYGLMGGADAAMFDMANPLIVGAGSLIIGGIFGIVSEKFAGILKSGD